MLLNRKEQDEIIRGTKLQQEIVTLFFRQGEPVRFNDEGRRFLGYIHCEARNRPGWYYVRDLDNRCHLVQWSDIEAPADEISIHPAAGRETP